jgi:hypothetical protein
MWRNFRIQKTKRDLGKGKEFYSIFSAPTIILIHSPSNKHGKIPGKSGYS